MARRIFGSDKERKAAFYNMNKGFSKVCQPNGKTFCKESDISLRPIIARAGGKSQLADRIINRIPEHKVYVEPFVGGGAVFLKKPLAEKSVINDKDKDVTTVFKAFKQGKALEGINMTPSKARFERIKEKHNKTAKDILYLNKLSFGSGMTNFSNKKYKGKRNSETGIKYQKAHEEDYKNKLKNTVVLNRDFANVMKKYDSAKTFHYLDPPYVGSEKVYKENDSVTPERVASIAKQMRGKVMVSYNNNPRVREAFKGMKFTKVNTRYTFSVDSNNNKGKELLITNY